MKVGVDFGSLEMTHYCFVEWLTTYSSLDECARCSIVMIEVGRFGRDFLLVER